MTDSPIKTRIDGSILEVTLDRPKANAIDLATSRIMGETFMAFRDDPALRVAIITGSGARFFSPGWDLKAAAEGDAVDGDYGVGGFGGLQELRGLNKPVLAAVNGIACGGGLELALSADMIIAADHATFALPEIRSGTVADAASVKLPKRIPYHIAMELLLTGRWFDADEGHRCVLINEVVPGEQLMDRTRELARLIASGPPLVYAAIKEIVRDAEDAYAAAAASLTSIRREAAGRLDAAVAQELAPLKMERAVFATTLAEEAAGPDGRDRVEFAVAPNPGAPPGPLARIASGGELSRFLLALKVCLSAGAEEPKALIFDEIDRGVGGATAAAVGARLSALSDGAQVLVVTHSPQVAARADRHFRIEKSVVGEATRTEVTARDPADRADEIARMLAGETATDAAREAARALLSA